MWLDIAQITPVPEIPRLTIINSDKWCPGSATPVLRNQHVNIQIGGFLAGIREGTEEKIEERYLEYIKRRICAVDHGGLSWISDEVYVFFYELERIIEKWLFKVVAQYSQHKREDIVDEVVCNSDIHFHWSMIVGIRMKKLGKNSC